jgi:AraC-like DNA-binding protein
MFRFDETHFHLTASFPLHLMDVRQGAIEEHSHEFFEMVYVRSGHGVHGIDGVAYPIQAGDLYLISPGERHSYAPSSGSEFRIVNVLWMPSLFDALLRSRCQCDAGDKKQSPRATGVREWGEVGAYIEPLLQRERRFAHRLHLSGRMAYRVEVLLDEMRREQTLKNPGHEVLLRHLFCSLIVLLSRAHAERIEREGKNKAVSSTPEKDAAGKGASDIVACSIEYLEANHTRAVRVDEVASHVAVSSSRLAHLFKERTGRGLIEYLHELRIARACAALLESDASVQSVATQCGYADARFFHRMFRRHTGCNPGQYRQHFGTETRLQASDVPWARA